MTFAFEALFDSLAVPVMVFDEALELKEANRLAYRVFGIRSSSPESLAALAAAVEGRQDLFNRLGAATMRIAAPGGQEIFEWKDSDRYFRSTVFSFTSDGCYFGLLLEEKTDERLLQQHAGIARSYLEAVLDSLPLGIIVMNRDMRVTAINSKQMDLFRGEGMDFSLLDTVGARIEKLFPDGHDPSWDSVSEEVLRKGESLNVSRSADMTDGGVRTFSIRIAPLYGDDEGICGALRTVEDITVRVELEKRLKESEILTAKLETVHQLAVTLSDRINNALTSIVTVVSLVQRMPPALGDDKNAALEEVFAQAKRISGFIARIRAMEDVKTIDYAHSMDEKMLEVEE